MATRWTNHKSSWSNCERCELSQHRSKVCLYRGKSTNCDVLFVGEAPGRGEDALGKPFVGPAGTLLDNMVEECFDENLSCGFTNLVACIPLEDASPAKVNEPPKSAIAACSDRLADIIDICNPKAVVCVGDLAFKWLPKLVGDWSGIVIKIHHPARILRAGVDRELLSQFNLVCLTELSDNIMEGYLK